MHRDVGSTLEEHIKRSAEWSALPCTVLRIFLVHNPLGAALVHCNFMSSSLRTFFLMMDISGALMLACLFLEGSGRTRRGGAIMDAECLEDSVDGIEETIGKLLAIGAGTMVLATFPGMFLGSLHSRSFKKFEYEGCPEWQRQLARWRVQDRIIWILGLPYCAFCIFFVVLFLANVAPDDHDEWAISSMVAIAQDLIIIPFGVALFIPMLAVSAISIASAVKKVKKEDLVHQRAVVILRRNSLREETVGSI